MARYTNDDLAKKIDDISRKQDAMPDELIKRLDDRYLKKEDADGEYITRREGAVAAGLVTFAATAIGLLISFGNSIANFIKGQ